MYITLSTDIFNLKEILNDMALAVIRDFHAPKHYRDCF